MAGTLVCNMEQLGGNWGWIAPEVKIKFNDDSPKVRISDAITDAYVGKDVPGKITLDTDTRISFAWTVTSGKSSKKFTVPGGGSTYSSTEAMRYRLSFFKGTATATMGASAGELQQRTERLADGTCILQ